MSIITDRHGHVISVTPDTLEDWQQAAEVEAGLRRELQALNAELVARLDAVFAVEGEYANNKGDCSCIFRSRNLEREYETGNCPHQKARAVIAKARGES